MIFETKKHEIRVIWRKSSTTYGKLKVGDIVQLKIENLIKYSPEKTPKIRIYVNDELLTTIKVSQLQNFLSLYDFDEYTLETEN